MPIKFRCVHCGQYLGISHSKAGTVVDCPTCGRSVKVPQKDGQAERVGTPALDHADSQLAQALNEVAAIAQSSSVALPEIPSRYRQSGDVRETREVHAPPPKVVPAAPQPPAERIEPAEEEAEETRSANSALEELASLAQAESSEVPPSKTTPSPFRQAPGQFPWTNEVPWKLWLAFIAVGFVAIIIGFAVGRWDRTNHSEPSAPDADQTAAQPTALQKSPPQPVDPMTSLGQIAVRGTVKTSSGKAGSAIQTDKNAWIYAFPLNPAGEKKIPADWFSSSAESTNSQVTVSALRLLGGNAVPAGKDGRFELRLVRPGRYHILVCSSRKTEASAQALPEFLKGYFQDPKAFLDRRLFHAEAMDYQGQAMDLNLEPLQP